MSVAGLFLYMAAGALCGLMIMPLTMVACSGICGRRDTFLDFENLLFSGFVSVMFGAFAGATIHERQNA